MKTANLTELNRAIAALPWRDRLILWWQLLKSLLGLTSPKPAPDSAQQLQWVATVNALKGAWVDDFPTLEEIRQPSGQDIEREEF